MTQTVATSADPVPTDVVFERASQGLPCWIASETGDRRLAPLDRWMGNSAATSRDRKADDLMLSACSGPTIDLGCGPGRLTAALTARGVDALGVDISATAVAMTSARGAKALHSNLFDPLPMTGDWAQVLLADGNIGIAGDPERILQRAAALVAPDGVVVAEVEPSCGEAGVNVERRRWETDVLQGNWYTWATLTPDAVPAIAARAGLQVTHTAETSHRCFVWLRGI